MRSISFHWFLQVTFSQRLYLFLSFTHTICFSSSLSTVWYLRGPRADCPLVHFTVCFKQELLCSANLPPSRDKWPFKSAAAHEFVFLHDRNGFFGKLGINVYCALLNRYTRDVYRAKPLGVGICCHGNSKTCHTKVAWSGQLCSVHWLLSLPSSFWTYEHENNKLFTISQV